MSGRLLYATWGYTTHDRRLVAAAADEGWDVLYARFDGLQTDVSVDPLPRGCRLVDWLGSTTPLFDGCRADFISSLQKLGKSNEVTVVQAGPVPTVGSVAVAADIAPTVVVSWASDLLLDTYQSETCARRAREALSGAAGVLVDCSTVQHRAVELGADPSRVVIVPWGVDLLDNSHADLWPSLMGPLKIVCLRSHEPLYDITTLIDAVATATHEFNVATHVHLAGSGSLQAELQDRAKSARIDEFITWHGRVDESDVHKLLVDSHIHVSTALVDGSSISLLQAMATGRPSIVTDIESNREWVSHGLNGWLTPSGDSRALALLLREISARPERLLEMGNLARNLAEARADWRVNRSVITDLYKRIQKNP